MNHEVFLAIDLGAGSGRVVAGILERQGESLSFSLEEVHRFTHTALPINGGLYWNTTGLFDHILKGLKKAATTYGQAIISLGIDSWGCDFALLDEQGHLLDGHHQYRDGRTDGMEQEILKRVSREALYAQTGQQTNFYNTSLQLLSEVIAKNPCLDLASTLLFTPNLLTFWLSGVGCVERTIASTSQLYNPSTRDWAWSLIDTIGLPRQLFGSIIEPATPLGGLLESICKETGLSSKVQVIATAGHDTACAVGGLSLEPNSFWLSSGTWSILGVERALPCLDKKACSMGLSNEGGLDGGMRLLQNVSGLWMMQECKRHWEKEGLPSDFATLDRLSHQAKPFEAFVNPDDKSFTQAGNMPERIARFCQKTGQAIPSSQGSLLRVATESLALKYAEVIARMSQYLGVKPVGLHAGGGGIKDTLLMQSAANALGIPVYAGPVEATACGNILGQMIGSGRINDLKEGRELVGRSFPVQSFLPDSTVQDAWQGHKVRFAELLG